MPIIRRLLSHLSLLLRQPPCATAPQMLLGCPSTTAGNRRAPGANAAFRRAALKARRCRNG